MRKIFSSCLNALLFQFDSLLHFSSLHFCFDSFALLDLSSFLFFCVCIFSPLLSSSSLTWVRKLRVRSKSLKTNNSILRRIESAKRISLKKKENETEMREGSEELWGRRGLLESIATCWWTSRWPYRQRERSKEAHTLQSPHRSYTGEWWRQNSSWWHHHALSYVRAVHQ